MRPLGNTSKSLDWSALILRQIDRGTPIHIKNDQSTWPVKKTGRGIQYLVPPKLLLSVYFYALRQPYPGICFCYFIRYLLFYYFIFLTYCSSAPEAYVALRGFDRDALLHTTVVMVVICVTVTFRSALTSLELLLWPLSLAMHLCPQNCCSLDVFCFVHHSLQTLRLLCMKIHGDHLFLRY